MAGSLKTNIALTSAGSWLKVMGQGVRSLTANDEYTASIQLQNRGSSKATALVALVHGNAAPASDDVAGVMRPIEIDKDAIQPIDRIACEAGVTVWVKADQIMNVWAFAQFNSTQ